MAYTGMNPPDYTSIPGTINPAGSLVESNPLPPPGRPVDGQAHLHPPTTAIHQAVAHVVTVALGGTISTGGVWLLTFTPDSTLAGVPAADGLAPVTLTVTVGLTETATALGDLFVTVFAAAKVMSSPASVDTVTRIGEFVASLANVAGTLTATGSRPGEAFTVTATPQSGGSATITNTVDGAGTDLRIGVFCTRVGTASDGVTPLIRACQSGDAAEDIYGLVVEGDRMKAIDPVTGYVAQYFASGREVPVAVFAGKWTAHAEATTAAGGAYYVRVAAGAGEVAGAVSGTATTDTVNELIITPTPANTTNFALFVSVADFFTGAVVAQGVLSMTSDADATAAEIVTGLLASLGYNTALDDYIAGSGTDTAILTATAGYTISVTSTAAGALAIDTTAAASDHVLITRGKINRANTGPGVCSIQF